MARHKEAPYYLRSRDGRAVLEYRTPSGQRKKALNLPYDPASSSPAECRAAREAAEATYRELTAGRVVEEHARIKTENKLSEVYALYLERWTPPAHAPENERRRLQDALVVRRAYGRSISEWASGGAQRPDGTPRWKDRRTPFERLVANDGPSSFLEWRLTQVTRKSMRKEKSNLVQFLNWAKAHGYLATVPAVELPTGSGTKALVNGRGVHIPLPPDLQQRIIAVLPEWSSRSARNGGERFLVRPFFDLMGMTGLREATLSRLQVPRNWKRGKKSLALDNADDKAKYGREIPLISAAIELLEKYAPESGHIFGHHDFRKHLKAAAGIVFKDEPEKARLFGGYHFRHGVGTWLAKRSVTGTSYVMGHKDLGTTSVYVHPEEEEARELLAGAEPERLRARKKAEAWAKRLQK